MAIIRWDAICQHIDQVHDIVRRSRFLIGGHSQAKKNHELPELTELLTSDASLLQSRRLATQRANKQLNTVVGNMSMVQPQELHGQLGIMPWEQQLIELQPKRENGSCAIIGTERCRDELRNLS
eukprot:TRINITY_DN11429_c0_g1_i19.p3 TRINITY_DN11429_c0_g1~~TRINITY_DN11429_c0_g1_i19.p3  ORF type:complete len:124 (-),score=22.34 TRINITY_DN11429_c0_g1_i19:248-619(-)